MQVAYLGENEAAGDRTRRGTTAGHFTVGKIYTVYGLRFEPTRGMAVDVVSDSDMLVGVPLALFKITDSRVSKSWEARAWDDGGFTLWPASFYRPYYHDDLSESVPEVLADFRQVRATIESGFTKSSPV